MKKTVCIILVFTFILMFAGCGIKNKTANVKISLGESEIFSLEDRQKAADCIVDSFKHNKNITVLSNVYYAGDEKSAQTRQNYAASENSEYDEMIVFMVSFHTSKKASSEGFNPDEDYSGYLQIYGRSSGGEWKYTDGGY